MAAFVVPPYFTAGRGTSSPALCSLDLVNLGKQISFDSRDFMHFGSRATFELKFAASHTVPIGTRRTLSESKGAYPRRITIDL